MSYAPRIKDTATKNGMMKRRRSQCRCFSNLVRCFADRKVLMRLHFASDHAGFEMKQHLIDWARSHGHEVIDHGPDFFDPQDDYPAFCLDCAEGVVADEGSLGVVLGGSGNGEQMAANLVDGCRAALAWSVEVAKLAREHNDANVISFGARMHTVSECEAMLQAFIETPFSAGERHIRRISQLTAYEAGRTTI